MAFDLLGTPDHPGQPLDLDLEDPRLYVNRELSWLEFNGRVLDLAIDRTMPLLERLRFLCISSTNLDEFFEVRVARLKEQIRLESLVAGSDGMSPTEQLNRISAVTHGFVADQYRILNDVLIPELAGEGIRFIRRRDWNAAQRAWIRELFEGQVLPVLSPLGIDPSHPFPRVLNKSLNFIVSLKGPDAFGRDSRVAVVQAPRSLPRLFQMPPGIGGGAWDFVFLSSVIHAFVGELFPGMKVKGCYQFRATRNSDLFVDEEEIEDLRIALENELFGRHYGNAVRLEVADNCSDDMTSFLLDQFGLGPADCFRVNGPVNLNRLLAIPRLVDRPDLKFRPFVPSIPPALQRNKDIFEAVRGQDVLLHHPYQSFTPVVELLRQAAADPDVLAIKITLYRTDVDSALIAALIDAARAGKEVTALVELRARFDEAMNIELSSRLQDAGAHVVYGVVGFKTHAKMTMIVRREGAGLRRYVHLGTGNYHPDTSRLYTDLGLLTSDPEICGDVHKIFMQLTGLGREHPLEKLKQSPFTLLDALIGRIDREAAHARKGRAGRIVAKMNALTEPQIIRALYRASQAGVEIDLIVRGICCLRAGVPGVSQNIRVRSVIGRFLEHSRVYYFHDDGADEIFLASADWMNRNLFRRVEQAAPIEKKRIKRRIRAEAIDLYLADNTHAWLQQPDGSYRRLTPGDEPPVTAQLTLLQELAENA